MTVYQLIKTCCDICDIPTDQTVFDDDISLVEASSLVGKMLVAARMSMDSLYAQFAPICTSTFTAKDNQIVLPASYRVIRVQDSVGAKVAYYHTQDGIFVDGNGTYTVTYKQYFAFTSWEDFVQMPLAQMSHSIMVAGTVSAYYALTSDLQRHTSWQQVFEQATQTFRKVSSAGCLPTTNWI